MITTAKLEIYKRYDGDVDGWGRRAKKKEKEIMTDADFYEIQVLIQKVTILKRGFASEEFAQRINDAIQMQTDNQETADMLMKIA
jgi:hypothetical protein